MDLPLPPDFKEFLKLLNSAGVEYLLVGGYAVSVHGYPRPTGDLDIWVAMTAENAKRLVGVLGEFGFANASPGLFLTPGQIVRMGVPPVRIEVLCSISGVEFARCRDRALEMTLDGVQVPVIGKEDLLTNKLAAGREKDLNDLKHLKPDAS